MLTLNATQVRKEWSSVVDTVVREKPQFIKRTRDRMFLANIELLSEFLAAYTFSANVFIEADGSVTLSLNELDLVENGKNEQEALSNLSKSILEYSEEYYNDFTYWSSGNRSSHKPYVFKALILGDVDKIGAEIICHHGKT